MAIKFTYRGATVELQTVREAAELLGMLPEQEVESAGERMRARPEGPPDQASRVTPTRYQLYMSYLNQNQKRALQLLKNHPDGLTDERLRQEMGIESGKALGGMLSGLSKLAQKAGFDISDVYRQKPVTIGGKNLREFQIQPQFSRLMAEQGT